MPRTARLVVGGCPYPIVRRGKNRGQVFFVDDDRRYYLKRLRRQTERFGLAVQAYCLMTKHLHVIATPRAQDSSGQRRRPDESVLHARRQRPSRPQRAPPAGPLLLQLAGRGVVLERADLRGAQSGPREAGAQGVALPVVERGGALRRQGSDGAAGPVGVGEVAGARRGLAGVAVAATGRGGGAARAFVELPKLPTR